MTKLYQYDSLVEPVSQDPEAVSIDKWQGESKVPVRKSLFASAVFATSLFFVPVVSAVEEITIDKWLPSVHQPIQITQDINRGSFDIDLTPVAIPEDVTLDKWFQPVSEPVREIPEIVRQYFDIDANLLTQAESVRIDKWFQPASEPVRQKKEIIRGEGSFVEDFVAENIFLDKWHTQYHNPVLPKQDAQRYLHHYDVDPFILTQGESISIDKWYMPLSEPVRTTPEITRGEGVFVEDFVAEVVTIDKWFVRWPDPVRKIRRPVNTTFDILVDFSVPVEAGQINLDTFVLSQSKLSGIQLNQSRFNIVTLEL